MIQIRDRLTHLKNYAEQLNEPTVKEPEKIKKQAFKALSELNDALKNQDLSPQEWNEIFEVVHSYSQLDLSTEPDLVDKVFGLFKSRVPTPQSVVKNLVSYVDKKRSESTLIRFNEEKANVQKEYQGFIKVIITASTEFSLEEVREFILAVRAHNPRTILSVQDEVTLLRDLLNKKAKELQSTQKESTSMEPSKEVGNLKKMVNLLERTLFTLESSIEKKSQKANELGVTVLEYQAPDLNTQAIERMRVQRLFRLENLREVYQQSMNRPNPQVASKCFPPTYAWYVGAFQRDPTYSLFELEMQQIGEENGIKVITDIRHDQDINQLEITSKYRTDLMLDCQPLVDSFGHEALSPFSQDYVDFSKNGEVRIPRMRQYEESEQSAVIKKARKKRSPEWRQIYENPEAVTPLLGAPFNDNFAIKAVALASSIEATPIMNLTYNEGGNSLIGERGNRPFVIIGRDSYVMSKTLMEKDLGREMTDEEVRLAFAIDYGVELENIYFVEQPGDFHLDMSMCLVGENTILLNDADLAQKEFAEEQQIWLKQAMKDNPQHAKFLPVYVNEEIRESAVRKKMEDLTAQDLKRQGFNVIRVPGRFNYSSRKPAMNFFNMVTAETPNGETIVTLMGCISQKFQTYFRGVLEKFSERKIDKFYFLDLVSSQDCLYKGGGISCRAKTIPRASIEK